MSKGNFIGFGVGLLFGAFFVFLFTPKVNEIRKLQDTIEQRKNYLATLEEQIREAKRIIEQIKNDNPVAIEAIARDKYGYTREGEEIYQVEKTTPEAGQGALAPEAAAE